MREAAVAFYVFHTRAELIDRRSHKVAAACDRSFVTVNSYFSISRGGAIARHQTFKDASYKVKLSNWSLHDLCFLTRPSLRRLKSLSCH